MRKKNIVINLSWAWPIFWTECVLCRDLFRWEKMWIAKELHFHGAFKITAKGERIFYICSQCEEEYRYYLWNVLELPEIAKDKYI